MFVFICLQPSERKSSRTNVKTYKENVSKSGVVEDDVLHSFSHERSLLLCTQGVALLPVSQLRSDSVNDCNSFPYRIQPLQHSERRRQNCVNVGERTWQAPVRVGLFSVFFSFVSLCYVIHEFYRFLHNP